LWEAWLLSRTWGCRPSDLYGLGASDYVAFCFDRAIATFGLAVEADMDEAAEGTDNAAQAKSARQRALNNWLTLEGDEPMPGTFRDPFATR